MSNSHPFFSRTTALETTSQNTTTTTTIETNPVEALLLHSPCRPFLVIPRYKGKSYRFLFLPCTANCDGILWPPRMQTRTLRADQNHPLTNHCCRLHCAFPMHNALSCDFVEDFYAMFGPQYISKSVERRFEVVGKPMQHTPLTRALLPRTSQGTSSLVGVASRDDASCGQQCGILIGSETPRVLSSHDIVGQRNSIYVVDDFDWFGVGYAVWVEPLLLHSPC